VANALADLEQAETGGRTPETLVLRGRLHRYQGQNLEALAALEQALQLDPGHLKARINRAGLLADLESPAEGLQELERLLDDPRVKGEWRVKAQLQHAGLLAVVGQLDQALAEVDLAEAMPEAAVHRDVIDAFRARIQAAR
jgi:predicted RNA polymerase sigma factor